MTERPVENLEGALNRALERHAAKAPAPASDLFERVETRYRRRRRVRTTGAAAAMALVLSGTAFGMWSHDGGSAVLLESPSPGAQPLSRPGQKAESPFRATPVEKLWPEAVHRIPARLRDGTEIMPQTLIDERTVLVNSWGGFEKPSVLYAYDLPTGEATRITDVVTPKNTQIFASGFTVGEGRIFWHTTSTDLTSTIWSVPVKGGTAVVTVERTPAAAPFEGGAMTAGQIPGGQIGDLTVSGGKLYWSRSGGGVYTAPVAGGPAEPVPGTEEEMLVQWPWVGGLASDSRQDRGRINGRDLRNLETGEKKTAAFSPGEENWDCGITWCLAGSLVKDRSGTETFRVSGHPAVAPNQTASLDRFVASVSRSDQKTLLLLNDLRTRRSGSIELVQKDDEVSYSTMKSSGSRMYSTRLADEYVIVDLKAIG
ncbi:hypothetical protein [Actinocorallia populi]|uniref:hypothetical protein n=1 Tax=Actinocorallia populi TaxID=2079200 RepID=UPI000D08F5F8|nr:hypothetical protein [Actinocorallia populi]